MSKINDMIASGVHIGSRRQYWSPKMRNFIYGSQGGIHVFDLIKTEKKLDALIEILRDFSSKGKTILLVGTKLQAREIVANLAKDTGNFYINNKWVPGLITNFPTIKKRIAAYNQLEKDLQSGALAILGKKEQAVKMKEFESLRNAYEGIKDMKRVPDALLVVDGFCEELALAEARKIRIPTYALLGSTGDIDKCTDFVPCNVNGIKSLSYIFDLLKPVLVRAKKELPSLQGGKINKLAEKRGIAPKKEEVAVEEISTEATQN